jgi:dihydropteroate synthase
VPELWGVLNVTPDSFSDGGRYLDHSAAAEHGRQMRLEGAHVIDVGGESSRPAGRTYGEGFSHVPAKEEVRRVVPVIQTLAREGAKISIDTVKPEVAAAALAAGATVVNDVRCAEDPGLAAAAAAAGADYVIMHNRGLGEVKGPNIAYADVVQEVLDELLAAAERVEQAGVPRASVWLDPGVGFAKTAEQSIELLRSLGRFKKTGYRVLVGPSRKSFIAELAPNPDGSRPEAEARLGGTAAAVAACVAAGVDAVRVHDVYAMRQVAAITDAVCVRERGTP